MYKNEDNEVADEVTTQPVTNAPDTDDDTDEVLTADSEDIENTDEASEPSEELLYSEEDTKILARLFPEAGESALTPRYMELRALGLTPEEAYLASGASSRPVRMRDTRSHLTDSYPRTSTTPPTLMTRRELREAREIFSSLDDSEIMSLYKRVTR